MTQEVNSHMPDEVTAPAPETPVVDTPVSTDTPIVETPAEALETETGETQGLEALPESWQTEIRKLRDEAATRRTALKPYEEVFSPYAEEDREVLFDLMRTLAADPTAGAKRMAEIAQVLLEGESGDPGEPSGEEPPTEIRTVEDLEKWYEDRRKREEAERADAEAVKALEAEVAELGYTVGSGQHYRLLWEAKHTHGGDLAKAHAALEAERQQIAKTAVDEFLAGKRRDADTTPTAGSGGAAPSNSDRPRDFKSARASLEARLNAAFGED